MDPRQCFPTFRRGIGSAVVGRVSWDAPRLYLASLSSWLSLVCADSAVPGPYEGPLVQDPSVELPFSFSFSSFSFSFIFFWNLFLFLFFSSYFNFSCSFLFLILILFLYVSFFLFLSISIFSHRSFWLPSRVHLPQAVLPTHLPAGDVSSCPSAESCSPLPGSPLTRACRDPCGWIMTSLFPIPPARRRCCGRPEVAGSVSSHACQPLEGMPARFGMSGCCVYALTEAFLGRRAWVSEGLGWLYESFARFTESSVVKENTSVLGSKGSWESTPPRPKFSAPRVRFYSKSTQSRRCTCRPGNGSRAGP